MPRPLLVDDNVLRMALIGYEQEKVKIEAAIANIRAQLGDSVATSAKTTGAVPKVRKMSAAARKRIAAAQKKRWAAFRTAETTTETVTATPSRKLSAAARKAIIAAARERWKAFREAQRPAPKKVGAPDEKAVRRLGKPVRRGGKLVYSFR